jgi:hypothetical protein
MNLLQTIDLKTDTGQVLEAPNTIVSPAHELRTEIVELHGDAYTLDLTKYTNINFFYIRAYYSQNDQDPPVVKLGDIAPFNLNLNLMGNVGHKGYVFCYPTTAPTSITIQSIQNKKVKFHIYLGTES